MACQRTWCMSPYSPYSRSAPRAHLICHLRQWSVIPKHFIPPMLVNGLLGYVLWSTYSEASSFLEPYLASHPTTLAAVSGALAGGTQAIVAAPAENMRFALEGTSPATGWHDAWKEVFLKTEPATPIPRAEQLHEARQVRDWMRDVGEMAGRGWDGWGWGCAKDICGECGDNCPSHHTCASYPEHIPSFSATLRAMRRLRRLLCHI